MVEVLKRLNKDVVNLALLLEVILRLLKLLFDVTKNSANTGFIHFSMEMYEELLLRQ